MALLDTFRGFLESQEQADRRINEKLKDLYIGFLLRAELLRGMAATAPSDATESDIRRLADDHAKLARLVGAAIEARTTSVPKHFDQLEPAHGINHWARLVEGLVIFQHGRDKLMDLSRDLLETYPEFTDLFDVLTMSFEDHIARLRGEIARADPQAHN